jgi:hypothetical protein
LSDDRVILQVTANLVPVAVNLYKVRKLEDDGGKLFRSVQRQKDQYQGIWIVSPEGNVLAGLHDFQSAQTWSQEVLDTIAAALKSYGPVQPRKTVAPQTLRERGKGFQPDGKVSLALYSRYLHEGKADGPPVIDTLTLDKSEWAGFLPPKPAKGTEWTVPDAVARKLVRLLSPNSDQSTMPRPEEATVATLKGLVEANDGKELRIRWTGKIEARHLIEGDAARVSLAAATIEGVARADAEARSLQIVLLVARGTYRHSKPYDQPRQIGAVAEWQALPEH